MKTEFKEIEERIKDLDAKEQRKQDNLYTAFTTIWLIVFTLGLGAIASGIKLWVIIGLVVLLLLTIIYYIESK